MGSSRSKSTKTRSATGKTKKAGDGPSDSAVGQALESLPGDFCPVGRALEILGARWTLVLVRHLLTGPRGFQELRERTGMGPRVLSTRLKDLVARDIVEKVPVGNRSHYAVTDFGKTLEPVIREISLWWLRHAMARTETLEEASAASVMEAVTFLLKEDGSSGEDFSCDIRLTVRNGGWRMEIGDASQTGVASEPVRRNEMRESESTAEITDGYGGGTIAWYPDGAEQQR